MPTIFGLDDGKVTVKTDDGRVTALAPDDIHGLKEVLKKAGNDVTMFSSSVNYPAEHGFKRSFDMARLLARARLELLEGGALVLERGPARGTLSRLKELIAKGRPTYPFAITFVGVGVGDGETMSFRDEDETRQFLNGVALMEVLLTPPDDLKPVRVKRVRGLPLQGPLLKSRGRPQRQAFEGFLSKTTL